MYTVVDIYSTLEYSANNGKPNGQELMWSGDLTA